MKPAEKDYIEVVRRAVEEDLGSGDVSSEAAASKKDRVKGVFTAKSDGVLSGVDVARSVFKELSASVKFTALKKDGRKFRRGDAVARVAGPARAVLGGERTALNFLQRMSGIATLTARYVEKVGGTRAKIYDTRKTTPGLRVLEKYAVACGGGVNHRFGLFDMYMFKDNHIALASGAGVPGEGIRKLVAAARAENPGLDIVVEAEDTAMAMAALEAGADVIMLDNYTPARFRDAARLLRKEARRLRRKAPGLEASGGITLRNVRRYAEAGADRISIGALTHSAAAADISLDVE